MQRSRRDKSKQLLRFSPTRRRQQRVRSPPTADSSCDNSRFHCPFPGCKRSFAELWRLKVHYRAPPGIKGSGRERGHHSELAACPKCKGQLFTGKHHIKCTAEAGQKEDKQERPKQEQAPLLKEESRQSPERSVTLSSSTVERGSPELLLLRGNIKPETPLDQHRWMEGTPTSPPAAIPDSTTRSKVSARDWATASPAEARAVTEAAGNNWLSHPGSKASREAQPVSFLSFLERNSGSGRPFPGLDAPSYLGGSGLHPSRDTAPFPHREVLLPGVLPPSRLIPDCSPWPQAWATSQLQRHSQSSCSEALFPDIYRHSFTAPRHDAGAVDRRLLGDPFRQYHQDNFSPAAAQAMETAAEQHDFNASWLSNPSPPPQCCEQLALPAEFVDAFISESCPFPDPDVAMDPFWTQHFEYGSSPASVSTTTATLASTTHDVSSSYMSGLSPGHEVTFPCDDIHHSPLLAPPTRF